MTFRPNLLALAILSSLSLPLHAQTAPEGDADARSSTLDTVEVWGQTEKKSSANQSVTVIDSSTLEEEQAQNMEDALRYIPGITVTDMGRFGDSGFNIRGLEGDRVAIIVDGLSLAETTDTAVAYEFFRAGRGGVDVDTLKQIEVVRGADSISSGSGALSGAVVFTTKDPADYLRTRSEGNDTHVGIKGGYSGTTNEFARTLTFANRTGIVESMLVYTRRDGHEAESFHDDAVVRKGAARETPDPADRTNTSLLGKLDFVLSDSQRIGLVYERGRNESELDNLSRADSGSYFRRIGDDSSERDRYGIRWFWTAENALFDNLEATADHQKTNSLGITRVDIASGTSGGTRCTVTTLCSRAEDRSTEQSLDRINFDFDKRIQTGGLDHQLLYGFAWDRKKVDTQFLDWRWNNVGALVSTDTDPRQQAQTDVNSMSFYLRDAVRLLNERLTLTAGVRHDRHEYSPKLDAQFGDNTGTVKDFSFNSTTGQLGADFRFTDQHSIWGQVGSGFRAPSVAQMYGSTSTNEAIIAATGQTVTLPSSVANPDLKAEKSINLEFGYRYQTDSTRWGVSVFRDKYSNFVETAQILANPDIEYRTCAANGSCTTTFGYTYSTPVNRGKVETKGVEVEGHWLIDSQWSARFAGSYTKGEKNDGTPLDSIQPANAVVGVNYRAPSRRWSVTSNVTHSWGKDSKDTDPDTALGFGTAESAFVEYAKAWTTMDLFGTFNVTDDLRLTAGVYNLFDKEYYQWYRVRTLNSGGSYLHGGVVGNGIHRYTEPGRNYRITASYSF